MRALLIMMFVGCGRLDFDPRDDGALLADTSDAPFGMFGPAEHLATLGSSTLDDDPTLTGDQLEIYFATTRAGGVGLDDIWFSVRNSVDEAWPAPQPVMGINSTAADESPGITSDGLELYFASARAGGSADIYVSIRNSRGESWPQPVPVAELSGTSNDYQAQPSLSKLRLVMYREGGPGGRDLYEAARTVAGAQWMSPQLLSTISSPSGERSPCLSGNELGIVFSSDRMSASANVHDLYLATRSSVDAAFGPPTPISELNTGSDEDDAWLSPDGRAIYFSSDRSGNSELYVAKR